MILKTRITKGVFALLAIGILLSASLAQQTRAPTTGKESQEDRIALHQALLDLTNPWTVMCIAAHPDDEDGTSLIVMRRKHGARTVSVFTTFGEGGQNAIGPELYEELGAIRIRETMAASEIQGSEPYFLGLKDFGYSKSADEAYRVWGRDESLRRMVLQIRKLRPDVIITNHDASRGHGHHQATGQLVLEAFDAASDPKRFPEQLKDEVRPWQVQRLFVRGFGVAPANNSGAQPAGQKPDREGGLITIDPNERDPIRGSTYAEQALQALQKHATQGPWPQSIKDMARFRNSPDGKLPLIRYRLIREAKDLAPLPTDSHNFLDGLRLLEEVKEHMDWLKTVELHPSQIVKVRAQLLKKLTELRTRQNLVQTASVVRAPETGGSTRWLQRTTARLNEALTIAAGLSVKLVSADNILVPGRPSDFSLIISNKDQLELRPQLFFSGVGDDSRRVSMFMTVPSAIDVMKGKTVIRLPFSVPKNTPLTLPRSEHLYDERFAGLPVAASAFIEFEGVGLPLWASTSADVAPLVEIAELTPSPMVLRFKKSAKPPVARFKLINHTTAPIQVGIVASSPTRKLAPQNCRYDLAASAERSVTCAIAGLETPFSRAKEAAPARFPINLSVRDLKKQTVIGTKTFQVVWINSEVSPEINVGYIRGFDNSLPDALAALSVEAKELSIADVRAGDLQRYSAILVDNRVYESQRELIAINQRLLDYAKDGGTLVVFYHKSSEWNPNPRLNRPQLAPYPIILNDERITDENAPMTFIEPQHHLLNFPNKIGQEDFAGWIQERGLYYPKEWDVKYRALLATNDPGEAPLRGGLLVADYGRGHYIYTSMVWYRQLRGGVPGAYRMLANMISYGK